MLEQDQKIIEELKRNGYVNKKINYEEFLELYHPYITEMSEVTFAELLGISQTNLWNLKNRYSSILILKEETLTRERKKEIAQKLRIDGYEEKTIDYEKFKQLYEPYKEEMTELDFSTVLAIKYRNFTKLKYNGTKTIILSKKMELAEKRNEEIEIELRAQGNSNKIINYSEFLVLYQPYRNERTEREFAEILGIKYNTFTEFKHKGTTKILKETKKIATDRKREIKREINKLNLNRTRINYEDFLELYKKYDSEMSKKEFAKEILGVNYENIKNAKTRAIIKLQNEEFRRIKYKLSLDNRKYSKEDLETICKEYDVKLDDFVMYLYKLPEYLETLNSKGYLYIGKFKMDRTFVDRYSDTLLKSAKSISNGICKNFNSMKSIREDIASDALMYVLKNKGDIVLNIDDESTAVDHIERFMNRYIKCAYLMRSKIRKEISLDEQIGDDKKVNRYMLVKSKDITNEIDEEITYDGVLEEIRNCYGQGLTNKESVDVLMQKYDMTREEILEILETELTKRRRIVKDKNGKIYLGEELE